MRIATGAYAEPGSDPDADSGLIGFEERLGSIPAVAGCGCPNCAARPRTARPASASGGGRVNRVVRSTCLATTVLAGAGVVGLTVGAGSAQAAAGRQGWDGSKYWFRNGAGEWRWTSRYDVYASRTGKPGGPGKSAGAAKSGGPGKSAATGSSGGAGGSGAEAVSNGPASSWGPRQGWDGSKYWFRNGAGEWRWTSHYDVYLSRTGKSGDPGKSAGDTASSGSQASSGDTAAPGSKASSGRTEAAVDYALAQLGKPYVWGGDGPSGYDCSGLVQQAYLRSGINLPRVADDQYAATTPIGSGQLRRGDLVFWSDSGRASGIHHVGIYLGDGTFVEAPRPGRTVRISALTSGYYPTHFGRP
ncbi:C40 family peptidase [Kitasatospora sp. NPDC048194]|uniref:C40 family peptidase n=1 Tax=Kitasatospora sp. NPDC048194 TaxID=3364045 RepID=UPI00370FCF92